MRLPRSVRSAIGHLLGRVGLRHTSPSRTDRCCLPFPARALGLAWLDRMAGGREAAPGAGAVVSGVQGRGVGPWLVAGVAADVADAAILAAAAQNRSIGPVHGRLVAGTAVAAAAAGVWAA